MNYQHLFAFVELADDLNFTHAAARLHLSQPALHMQIKKLAAAVGRPLYRRAGRALALTPEGRQLVAFGREVRARGDVVLDELRGRAATAPVVLAAGQGAYLYLLGAAIRRFPKQTWPLRLLTLGGPDAIAAVREARAQLGVIAAHDLPDDLGATRLRTVGQRVVVPSAHRLAGRRALRAADLEGEPLVVAPAGSPHRAMLAQLLHGRAWTVAVEATGWDVMLHFARLGVGLAVVNDFCAPPRGTAAIPLEGAPRIAYHLIRRPGMASPGADALARLVIEHARG